MMKASCVPLESLHCRMLMVYLVAVGVSASSPSTSHVLWYLLGDIHIPCICFSPEAAGTISFCRDGARARAGVNSEWKSWVLLWGWCSSYIVYTSHETCSLCMSNEDQLQVLRNQTSRISTINHQPSKLIP